MTDFLSWISTAPATNWIALSSALAALLTAIFTGYTAYQARRSSLGRVVVEWRTSRTLGDPHITVGGTIRNRLECGIEVDRLIAKPAIHALAPAGREPKHKSWKHNVTPVRAGEVDPGKDGTFSVRLTPDWQQLYRRSQLPYYRIVSWLGRSLWKCGITPPRRFVGPAVSVSVIIARRSGNMSVIRNTHRIRMNADTAQQMLATIEKKAAT